MKLSEAAQEVLPLAREIREYWDRELPKHYPDYPIVHPEKDVAPPSPPQAKKLTEILRKLPDEQVYQLLVLIYLGRGDFGTEELALQVDELKQRYKKPQRAVAQLTENGLVDEYLEEGLAELKKSGIDVDSLSVARVHT